jgi:hypothetical protein
MQQTGLAALVHGKRELEQRHFLPA